MASMSVGDPSTAAASTIAPEARPSLASRFARHHGAAGGVVVMVIIVILAILGPQLSPHDPLLADTSKQLLPPGGAYILGTDQLGRDVASRILHGAALSLQIGIIAIAFAVVLGVGLGLPAGYFGGSMDMVVMRGIDVLLAFPSILLALSIVSVLGASLQNAMIAVGISLVPVYVRLVRGSALSVRTLPYVEASRVIGCSHLTIMIRHILPNVLAPLVVVATLGIATAIIVGAALSFLGLGAQPPTPEWGVMLTEGRGFIRTAWWLSVFPGVAIILTVLAINLIGDGLRDVLDPRMPV